MHYMRVLANTVILLATLLTASTISAQDQVVTAAVQTPITGKIGGALDVRIKLPDSMIFVDFSKVIPPPEGVLAARSKAGGFPTVNILREPGQASPDGSLQSIADTVVEQYRMFGLQEISLVATKMRRHPTLGELPLLLVNFTGDGTQQQARITFVPLSSEHLIVTFLSRRETADSDAATEQALFESLTLDPSRTAEVTSSPRTDSTSDYRAHLSELFTVACIGIAAAVLFGLKRRRRPVSRNKPG